MEGEGAASHERVAVELSNRAIERDDNCFVGRRAGSRLSTPPLSGQVKKCAIMQVAVERQCVYKLIVDHTMTNLLNAPHLMATWKVA